MMSVTPMFAYSSYESDSGFASFVAFLTFIGTILQIILFFKIWGMTNDVKHIKDKIVPNSSDGISEELNVLHFMGKDDECEQIILKEFYRTLSDRLNWAKSNLLEDSYDKAIDESISKFTDVVAKQYKNIGREMPDLLKGLKTYRDFINLRITEKDVEYPTFKE